MQQINLKICILTDNILINDLKEGNVVLNASKIDILHDY